MCLQSFFAGLETACSHQMVKMNLVQLSHLRMTIRLAVPPDPDLTLPLLPKEVHNSLHKERVVWIPGGIVQTEYIMYRFHWPQ